MLGDIEQVNPNCSKSAIIKTIAFNKISFIVHSYFTDNKKHVVLILSYGVNGMNEPISQHID